MWNFSECVTVIVIVGLVVCLRVVVRCVQENDLGLKQNTCVGSGGCDKHMSLWCNTWGRFRGLVVLCSSGGE